MNMETKVMMMSIVMRVYLIFWIIISAYGMQNECNNSLVSKLDINQITLITEDKNAIANRGNLRLSDDWPALEFIREEPPAFIIDLGTVYNITGMIIKGKEGYGTMGMGYIIVYYGNNSEIRNMTIYSVGGEDYSLFKGTTKEENIRYEYFYSPFLARYVALIFPMGDRNYDNVYALQIDFLGCNITEINETSPIIQTTESTTTTTTAIPCNDILKTSLGDITKEIGMCRNPYKIQIKFDESGSYQITSVNITITNDDLFEAIENRQQRYTITFQDLNTGKIYDIKEYKKYEHSRRIEINTINNKYALVNSLELCMSFGRRVRSNIKSYTNEELYTYVTVEVRGCPTVSGGFIQEDD